MGIRRRETVTAQEIDGAVEVVADFGGILRDLQKFYKAHRPTTAEKRDIRRDVRQMIRLEKRGYLG